MTRRVAALLLFLSFTITAANVAAAPPTRPLRLAFPSVGTLVSGQVGCILLKTDVLKRNGFEAKVVPMALGKELKTALVSGQIDVILTSESNFVVLVGQGFPARAVASLGSAGYMGLAVPVASTVATPSDLRGKKVGTIFGTSIHQPAIEWSRDAGLVPGKDVTIIGMRSVGALQAALAAGELDAAILFDPYLLESVKAGRNKVLKKTDLDLVAVASSDYLAKNPGGVPALRAALAEAVFHLATNKEQANGWLSELNGMPVPLIEEASRANANYGATRLSDVDVSISDRLRKKLARLNDFLFAEKELTRKVDVLEFIKEK